LADYAALLRQGTTLLSAGTTPSADWLGECQRFDDVLRGFDVPTLRRAVGSAKGRQLMVSLDTVKAEFEEAFSGVRDGLSERMNGARQHRTALAGYRTAGDRQRGGPKFITANL
jgi:hypothetical protein